MIKVWDANTFNNQPSRPSYVTGTQAIPAVPTNNIFAPPTYSSPPVISSSNSGVSIPLMSNKLHTWASHTDTIGIGPPPKKNFGLRIPLQKAVSIDI